MGDVAVEDVLPGIHVRVTAVHVTAEKIVVEAASCGPGGDRRVRTAAVRDVACTLDTSVG